MESLLVGSSQNSSNNQGQASWLSKLFCCFMFASWQKPVIDLRLVKEKEELIKQNYDEPSQTDKQYYDKKLLLIKQYLIEFNSIYTLSLNDIRQRRICSDLIRQINPAIMSDGERDKQRVLAVCESVVMKESTPEIRYNKRYRELHGNSSVGNSRFLRMSSHLYRNRYAEIESDVKSTLNAMRYRANTI